METFEKLLMVENVQSHAVYQGYIDKICRDYGIDFVQLLDSIDYYIFLYRYGSEELGVKKNSTACAALVKAKKYFVEKRLSFEAKNGMAIDFEKEEYWDAKHLVSSINEENCGFTVGIEDVKRGCISYLFEIVGAFSSIIGIIDIGLIFHSLFIEKRADYVNDLRPTYRRIIRLIVIFLLRNRFSDFLERRIDREYLEELLERLGGER